MQVSDLIAALELIGEVYRSADGTKPADAIMKLKSQLENYPNLTVPQWVAARTLARRTVRTGQTATAVSDLSGVLQSLEDIAYNSGAETAFAELDKLSMNAANWKELARLATGRREKSKSASQLALRSHLASRAQFKQRHDAAGRLFS